MNQMITNYRNWLLPILTGLIVPVASICYCVSFCLRVHQLIEVQLQLTELRLGRRDGGGQRVIFGRHMRQQLRK